MSEVDKLLDVFNRNLSQIRDALKAGVTVNTPSWTTSTFVTVSAAPNLTNERILTGTANQVVVTDNGAGSTVVLSTPQSLDTGASVSFNDLTVTNAGGLHILDTNASHDLILTAGSNITADRTLTITTGDANRTLTLENDFRVGTGPWILLDEADTDPTTTELDSLDSGAVYFKSNKFVIAYNNAGTITYITLDLDGSDITWTHNTTAP